MPYNTVTPTCYVCFEAIRDEWAPGVCELDDGELAHFECAGLSLDYVGVPHTPPALHAQDITAWLAGVTA